MAGLGSPPAGDGPGGWGDLPVDILLGLVFNYLDCFKDRLAVAGVCKAWRRVVSDLRAPPIPWLLLPRRGALPPSFVCLLGNGGNPHDHPVPAILHHMPRHISSARQGGWILVGTKDRSYEVVNFKSGARLRLPHSMRDIRDRISDQRFVRISAAAISPPPPGLGYVDPTALSDSTSAAFDFFPLSETGYTIPVPGFTIAAIMVGNTQLAFWPLADRTIWTPAPRNPGVLAGGLEDVIFYNQSFCVLTRNEHILKYHMPQAQSVHRMRAGRCMFYPRPTGVAPEPVVARFLVESRGRLLMVVQIAPLADMPGEPRLTTGFRVFSMKCPTGELALHRWVEEDLGNRVIFVGRGCSRSFNTSDLHPRVGFLSGIYFLDTSTFDVVRPKVYPCHDMGVWLPHGLVDRPFPDQEVSSSVAPAVWALPFRLEEGDTTEETTEEELLEMYVEEDDVNGR